MFAVCVFVCVRVFFFIIEIEVNDARGYLGAHSERVALKLEGGGKAREWNQIVP